MKQVLLCMLAGASLTAMDSPTDPATLEQTFKEKCSLYNEPPLTPSELLKLDHLLEKQKQEQLIMLARLKQKIETHQILPFYAEVPFQNLMQFAARDYIIRKTITVQLTQEKLVPCHILVSHENLTAVQQDPLIKKYQIASLDSILGELKWYVLCDHSQCARDSEKLKNLPY